MLIQPVVEANVVDVENNKMRNDDDNDSDIYAIPDNYMFSSFLHMSHGDPMQSCQEQINIMTMYNTLKKKGEYRQNKLRQSVKGRTDTNRHHNDMSVCGQTLTQKMILSTSSFKSK